MESGVTLVREGAVMRIALDRPARLNALDRAGWERLERAAAATARAPGIGCAIVQGTGGGAFSAGLDMSRFAEERSDPDQARAYGEATARATARLAALPMPSIAMIEGVCMGSGVDIACHCDLRFAAEDALFRVSPLSIGLFLDRSFVAGLVSAVGRARALEMVIEGRAVDAPTACAIGLVTRLIPAARLAEETLRHAVDLAARYARRRSAGRRPIGERRRGPTWSRS